MINYVGKYATAKVMIDNIDETTEKQIRGITNHPAMENSNIAIMPDCHAGAGCVIGFTQTINDKIIPNLVGVDLCCGVTTYCLGKIDSPIDFQELDEYVRKNIPHGFEHREKPVWGGNALKTMVEKLCKTIERDPKKVLRQIGTLGGGKVDCLQVA